MNKKIFLKKTALKLNSIFFQVNFRMRPELAFLSVYWPHKIDHFVAWNVILRKHFYTQALIWMKISLKVNKIMQISRVHTKL